MEPLTREQEINAYNSYMQKNGIQRELSREEKVEALNGAIGGTKEATQASAGIDLMGALSKVAGGAWDTFKDTNVLPLKDFKGNTIKYKDVPGIIGDASGQLSRFAKGLWSPTESETYKGLSQAYDVAKADPVNFAMQAPVALAKGAYDELLLGGIGTFKKEPLTTLSLVGKAPAVANKFFKTLGKMGKTGGKTTLSRLSGVPEDLLSDIAGQRRLGKNSVGNESFNEGLKNTTMEEFAGKVQRIVSDDLPDVASDNWDKAFKGLSAPKDGIDTKRVWDDLGSVLSGQRIKVGKDGFDFSRSDFRARPDLQNKITQMVLTLDDMDGKDVRDIHSALKAAYRIVDTIPIDDRASRRALGEIWGHYRDAVGNQIPGFNAMQKDFSMAQKALDGFRSQLFGNNKQGKLSNLSDIGAINKNIVAALDHMWSNNANRTVQRDFADKLTKEIKTVLGEDVDIKRVAGGLRVASGDRARFGNQMDVLIASGGGIMAGITGDVTTAIGPIFLSLLSSATVQNPKVAAGIARTLGASEEIADKIASNVNKIKKAVEAKGLSVEGLSAGAALTFLAGGDIDNEPTEKKPTMTQLLSRAQQERSRANQPAQ